MSTEDRNASLKELVTKTLHSSGVLGKIQAELRASVFLSLEEEFKDNDIPLVNKESRNLLMSPEGCIAASLIYDFLQCLKLEFTQSVFAPESSMTSAWSLKERSSLSSSLNIQDGSNLKSPLLFELIKEHQNKSKNNNQLNINTSLPPPKSPTTLKPMSLPSIQPQSELLLPLPPLVNEPRNNPPQEPVLKNSSSSESLSEKSTKVSKDISGNVIVTEKLSDKSDKEDSFSDRSNSKNLKQKLVNIKLELTKGTEGGSFSSSEDDTTDITDQQTDSEKPYEDDFSSANEKELNKQSESKSSNNETSGANNETDQSNKTLTETESNDEIEEDIGEDLSDLLNSACSIESDNTKDLSISKANDIVSYKENV